MSPTKLSGADYFFLVIAHHIKKQGIAGMDCRYLMRLDKSITKNKLEEAITSSPYLRWLERTRIQFRRASPPRWVLVPKGEPTLVIEHISENDDIPKAVFDGHVSLYGGNLYRFDIIQHPTHTTVAFTWHHILLDAFGASQVLTSLNYPEMAMESAFFGIEPKQSRKQQWNDLVIAKDYLRATTKEVLLKITPNSDKTGVDYIEKRFTEEETARIKTQVAKYSRGGIETPYLLGNIAIAYQQTLKARGEEGKDIWVPIPMEQRKAGASGPVVSNWHSMLFFRIKASLTADKKAMVKDLNSQFFEQVKLGIPQKYSNMLRFLRRLPIRFYYRLVKRPNGESLSGMLYSQSPSHESLSNFLGCRVTDITALPPNTTPPGISFQITTFDNRLKLLIQYSESCFTKAEIENLLTTIEKELIEENA